MKFPNVICVACGIALGLFTGCATPQQGVITTPPNIQGLPPTVEAEGKPVYVHFDVNLERSFVRSGSHLGAGAVAMYILVGPFSNNVIVMYIIPEGSAAATAATIKETSGTVKKQLNWGSNSFWFEGKAGNSLMIRLRSGGTREGMVDVGKISLDLHSVQKFQIALTETGAEIKSLR